MYKSGRGTLAFGGLVDLGGDGNNFIQINADGGTLELNGNGQLTGTANDKTATGSDLTSTQDSQTGVNQMIKVFPGGTFEIDNSTTYLPDRISDLATVDLHNATFEYIGTPSSLAPISTETIGSLIDTALATPTIEGDSRIVSQVGSGGQNRLIFTSMQRGAAGAMTFVGQGPGGIFGSNYELSATGANQVAVTTGMGTGNSPNSNIEAMSNGILEYADCFGAGGYFGSGTNGTGTGGYEFATITSTALGMNIIPLPSTGYTTNPAAAGPASNLMLTTPGTYTIASKAINALLLGPGVTLDGLDPASGAKTSTLTLDAGNLIMNAGSVLNVGYLGSEAASNEMVMAASPQATGSNAAVINSVISECMINDTSFTSAANLNKIGTGTLVWTAANEMSAQLFIDEGALNIRNSYALGAPANYVWIEPNAELQLQAPTPTASLNIPNVAIVYAYTGIESQYGPAYDSGAIESVEGQNTMAGLTGTSLNNGNWSIPALSASVWWPDLFPGDGLKLATGVTALGIGVDAGSDLQLLGQTTSLPLIKYGTGTLELGGPIETTSRAPRRSPSRPAPWC